MFLLFLCSLSFMEVENSKPSLFAQLAVLYCSRKRKTADKTDKFKP